MNSRQGGHVEIPEIGAVFSGTFPGSELFFSRIPGYEADVKSKIRHVGRGFDGASPRSRLHGLARGRDLGRWRCDAAVFKVLTAAGTDAVRAPAGHARQVSFPVSSIEWLSRSWSATASQPALPPLSTTARGTSGSSMQVLVDFWYSGRISMPFCAARSHTRTQVRMSGRAYRACDDCAARGRGVLGWLDQAGSHNFRRYGCMHARVKNVIREIRHVITGNPKIRGKDSGTN